MAKRRGILLRLAFWLPLTIWPVLLWIGTEPAFSTGRHACEALNTVATQALHFVFLSGVIGFVLICKYFRKSEEWVIPLWLFFSFVHWQVLSHFIDDRAICYS
ncbi:hypothetical protein EON79_15465 [bacterium]|nr:MAG: hypothetical protein EON79_15465 [bacterium]